MLDLTPIDRLPANFDEFAEEIAEGLTALYGEQARSHYLKAARPSFQAAVVHSDVDAYAVFDGKTAAGLLMAVTRGAVAQISFLHVLRRYAGRRVEQQLVTEAVRAYRERMPIEGILAEHVSFCPIDVRSTYAALGFECIERELMAGPLDAAALAASKTSSARPLNGRDRFEAATVIVDAYRDHPGRRLHGEVRDRISALAFLKSVAAGGYGAVRPGYCQAIWRDGRCVGVIVGCEVTPEVGFVLQVAVRAGCRGEGLGRELIRALASEFRQAGLTRIALGVTQDNPARRLYERLGFQTQRPVDAYIWWRD